MINLNEVFYEETALVLNPKSAKIKYNIVKTLSIISYVFTIIWFYMFYTFHALSNVVFDIILFVVPTATFILLGYFIGRFKNKFYQEFDYAFISGTVRIAKVIKSIKRKFLLEFSCYDIEKIGEYGSETCNKYEKTPGIKTQILTPNNTPANDKDFYYIVVNINAEKNILIFECTKTFILNILKFSQKTVLEKE